MDRECSKHRQPRGKLRHVSVEQTACAEQSCIDERTTTDPAEQRVRQRIRRRTNAGLALDFAPPALQKEFYGLLEWDGP